METLDGTHSIIEMENLHSMSLGNMIKQIQVRKLEEDLILKSIYQVTGHLGVHPALGEESEEDLHSSLSLMIAI